MTQPIIKVTNLQKTYQMGDVLVRALRGVSLEVMPGEFVAIMGPSGSGKSTFMNIIGCLDKPTEGSYILDGMEVAEMSDNRLAQVRNAKLGFVFQSFNLLARTSALANVELPLLYSGRTDDEDRGLAALERVGLKHRAHHKPKELSGGEQQRVAIARALVMSSPLILADEPTGNLDTRTSEEILAIFQEINREGKTIVIVTHEADIAAHTQRIIRFKDGKLLAEERNPKPLDAREILKTLPDNSAENGDAPAAEATKGNGAS